MPKLIVGLGNPGARYAKTRHNVGWLALDTFARAHGIAIDRSGHHGLYGEVFWGQTREKVILLLPLTYMNLSGRAVSSAARYYKIEPADILVVYDDLDLAPGKLRLRVKGGAGGHNGMKSLIGELGTEEFARLRIGIGRPAPHWDVVDWVLAPFGPDDAASVAQVMPRVVEAMGTFLTEGALKAMSAYNGQAPSGEMTGDS